MQERIKLVGYEIMFAIFRFYQHNQMEDIEESQENQFSRRKAYWEAVRSIDNAF